MIIPVESFLMIGEHLDQASTHYSELCSGPVRKIHATHPLNHHDLAESASLLDILGHFLDQTLVVGQEVLQESRVENSDTILDMSTGSLLRISTHLLECSYCLVGYSRNLKSMREDDFIKPPDLLYEVSTMIVDLNTQVGFASKVTEAILEECVKPA